MNTSQYSDNIKNLFYEIESVRGIDPQKTIEKCDALEECGRFICDDKLIGFARFTKGETYYLRNEMQAFFREIIACIKPFEKTEEWEFLASVNNLLGIVSVNSGNPPFALDYYFKAINYCRQAGLLDLECSIQINIGSLYFNVKNYERALEHFTAGLEYVEHHPKMEGRAEVLAAIYIGLGKTHLYLDNTTEALEYSKRIREDCFSHLVDADRLAVYCFEAMLFQKIGNEQALIEVMANIDAGLNELVPIMDVFDDIYGYLKMLVDTCRYEEFGSSIQRVKNSTKITTVKYLELKLMNLTIEMYKNRGMEEEYREAATDYYELVMSMNEETETMLSNMVSMRHELHTLSLMNIEEKERNKSLKKQTQTDPLTGIHNRLMLDEYGQEIFERAKNSQSGLGVVFLDIDYFKEYNDNYGHHRGDECIGYIASHIMELEKEEGVFGARYGGDEFVIIYEGCSLDEVYELSTRLKERVEASNIEHKYSKLPKKHVTISQGVFWGIPKMDEGIEEYIRFADGLLYTAKKDSRNTIAIATKE